MLLGIFLPTLLFAWIATDASASVAESPDFGIDGRVNLELSNEQRFRKVEIDKEGILELQSKRRKGLRAVADLKLSSDSGGLDLRELFLDFKSVSGNRFIVGQGKKRFGLEWDLSMEERLALSRSIVYQKLGTLSFVGRDTLLGYQTGDLADSKLSHRFSIHSSEGLNAAALYQLQVRITSKGTLSSYSLIQTDRIGNQWQSAAAQALSYSQRNGPFRLESEVFLGKDFIESEFNLQRGVAENVLFSAFTLGSSIRFHSLEPFGRIALLLDDLSDLGDHTVEATFGAKYYFRSRLYLGGELDLVRHRTPSAWRLSTESRLLIALRYFF